MSAYEYIFRFNMNTSTTTEVDGVTTVRMGTELHERIVRCCDCKHFTPKGTHKFENGKVNEDYCDYVRGYMLQITPDGFCAWGERKADDDSA